MHHSMMNVLRNAMAFYTHDNHHALNILRGDELMIGCMDDADLLRCWYNGKTPDRAKPMPKDPTLFNLVRKTPKQMVLEYREDILRHFERERGIEARAMFEADDINWPFMQARR